MLVVSIISFVVFIIFQALYIFVPLFKKIKMDFSEVIEEKGISVLIPAYNEGIVIENCITAARAVEYDNKEIIIINDGSNDNTMDLLDNILGLQETQKKKSNVLEHKSVINVYESKKYKDVFVIDKVNGGKADALNAGIEYAKKELVVTLDADSMLEKDSLFYINHYFKDDKVVAAGGTVHVVQAFEREAGRLVPRFKGTGLVKHQILHYIHGFYVKKYTQSVFNSIVVIAGAFGTFQREMLLNIDGFRKTVGEDMDITLKVYKYIKENNLDKKLIYAPEAICYTECPEDMPNFNSQRVRWQKAFIDCVVHYWNEFFVGFSSSLSNFVVFDGFILGTLSAFVTVLAPLVMSIDLKVIMITIGLILLASLFDFAQNIVALIVARRYGCRFKGNDYIKIVFFMIWERFTYKLIPLYLNTIGTIRYFIEEDKWNRVERKGEISIV